VGPAYTSGARNETDDSITIVDSTLIFLARSHLKFLLNCIKVYLCSLTRLNAMHGAVVSLAWMPVWAPPLTTTARCFVLPKLLDVLNSK